MLTDQTLTVFSEQVAAHAPTPGGGSVAAYVGCLGAALGAMAARFSVGRDGSAGHDEALAAEIDQLESLRAELLELTEADAQAYGKVSGAYGLPRGSEAEKQARRAAIQAALEGAMQPPLAVCRVAVRGLEVLDGLRGHVNAHLASDVAVGAYGLAAAYRSAWINVLINLKGLKDAERRRSVLAEGLALEARLESLERSIAPAIVATLV